MTTIVDLVSSSDEEDEVIIEDVNEESETDDIECEVMADSLGEDNESENSDCQILSDEDINTRKLVNNILKVKSKNKVSSLTSVKQDVFNSMSSVLTPEVRAVFDPCREPPPVPSEEGPRREEEELEEDAVVYLTPNTVRLSQRDLASSLVQVAMVREVGEEVVRVQMLYRPEDTCLNPAAIRRSPFSLLFHSSRLATVLRSAVVGRGAELRYYEEEEEGRVWSRRGEHRWFFTSSVDWEDGRLGLPSGLVSSVPKSPVLKRACPFKRAFGENRPFFARFL